MDSYIVARVNREVALRTQDEPSVVRELSNKVEDEVWARLKRYTWIVGIATVLLTLYGISSIKDAKQAIIEQARSRVEPIVRDVEKRSLAAQGSVANVEARLPTVTTSLNNTADLAEQQRQRIEGQSAEITEKLSRFQIAANKADSMSSHFEQQVNDSQRRLDQLTRRYDTQLSQISKTVTNQAIAEQYPSLTEAPYVQAGNVRLDRAIKKPGEKWVSVCIFPTAVGAGVISAQQLEQMLSELSRKGYTPILGNLIAGGRASGGIWRATSGNTNESTVVYFKTSFLESAKDISVIASKYIKFPRAVPQLSDGKAAAGYPQQSIDALMNDGKLDAEIFISAPYR